MFIDTAEIFVHAGKGGNGSVSFRREKHVEKGGPDGGDGGRGGDVVFRAARNLTTLMDFRYKRDYTAENGRNGMGARKQGKSGEDIVINVPVGTVIVDALTGKLIADLTMDNETVVVSRGGKGGRGNSNFATASNQTPRFAENGRVGGEAQVRLELKLLADVGLVGFPNAGKSTLISRISAARPKIAEYPFTTLVPNLGIVRVGVGKSFVVADIPGLIEGASEGKGLGLQFLRHVERSGVLCVMVDALGDDPERDYNTLMEELGKYDSTMLHKRRIACITKSDALDDEQRASISNLRFDDEEPMLVSSVSGENIDRLVQLLSRELDAWREEV